MGPEDGIDKLCFLKQQPNESVREFRARFDRLINTLKRLNIEFQDNILMLFFFVKLVDWKEIKAFEPKSFDDVFNVAVNLESKNKGQKNTMLVRGDGNGDRRKCYVCGEKGHISKRCPKMKNLKCSHCGQRHVDSA